MHNTPRIVALLALLATVACDVDDGTANPVGEGVVGIGLDSQDSQFEELEIDELTDAADPAFACSDAGWNASWVTLEDQVLVLVNQKRAAGATCGGVVYPAAPPLVANAQLRCAARNHSKDMGVNNFFSHTGSNGSTFVQRIEAADYLAWKALAENIAAGYATANAVVAGWMASTGHCKNIMNATYKDIGIGYYYGASATYKHYWTQDFGKK